MKEKRNVYIGVRITDSQKSYLESVAQEDDRTVSWVIQSLVEWYRQNKTPQEALKLVKETFSDK
mgnify:CR=1 FL=1